MDEQYLMATARYIEMNPVAAKMVQRPEDYPWSSARAHLRGEDDQLVNVTPLLQLIPDWSGFLQLSSDEEIALIQSHERTGRPLGKNKFVDNLEKVLGRRLKPQKPGPKKKVKS
jgi:putative transposase